MITDFSTNIEGNEGKEVGNQVQMIRGILLPIDSVNTIG